MARELEEENAVLMTALAAEFEAPVPTEQLRSRISLAVANVNAPVIEKRGFLSAFRNFVSFAPQQALGYAGLILLLAFAAIFGVIKMSQKTNGPAVADNKAASTPNSAQGTNDPLAVVTAPGPESGPEPEIPKVLIPDSTAQRIVHPRPTNVVTTPRLASSKSAPVKLLPGERTYLQTIARLDSAIKADKKTMRPTLQVEYERNLALVDRAIAATRTAAKSNPHDPDAADFMFAAYQSKVDLLNTIADARVGGRSH